MSLLIDGYNLLHTTGYLERYESGTKTLESARNALLRFLAAALRPDERHQTTIVFDAQNAPPGLPRQMKFEGIQVFFADKHAEADDLIEELIRQESVPKKLLVVSSDHRIQTAAQRRKAKITDSEPWFSELEDRPVRPASEPKSAPSKQIPETKDSIGWYEAFAEAEQQILDFEAEQDVPPGQDTDAPESSEQANSDKSDEDIEEEMKQLLREAGQDDLIIDDPFPPGYTDDLFD